MKNGSRSISRLSIGLLAIAATALAINFIAAKPEESNKRAGLPTGSTYSALYNGAEILYRLFDDLGFEVRRFHHPLDESYLDGDQVDVIWYTRGKVPVTRQEMDWLDLWVLKGGTLILINEPDDAKEPAFGEFVYSREDQLIERWLDRFGMQSVLSDVIDIGSRSVNRNVGLPAGPRSNTNLGNIGFVITYERNAASIPQVARFVQSQQTESNARRVIRDSHGTVVASLDWGEGEVWAVSDSYLFSNLLIREVDNAPVAVNMILESRGGEHSRILFDEYHLGFVRTRSISDAARTPVGRILIYLSIIGALAIGTAGARFGKPLRAQLSIGVSQRAFVKSLAGMWQAAGATSAVADALWRRYQSRRSVKALGLDIELDKMRKGRSTEENLLALARKLDSVEKST